MAPREGSKGAFVVRTKTIAKISHFWSTLGFLPPRVLSTLPPYCSLPTFFFLVHAATANVTEFKDQCTKQKLKLLLVVCDQTLCGIICHSISTDFSFQLEIIFAMENYFRNKKVGECRQNAGMPELCILDGMHSTNWHFYGTWIWQNCFLNLEPLKLIILQLWVSIENRSIIFDANFSFN